MVDIPLAYKDWSYYVDLENKQKGKMMNDVVENQKFLSEEELRRRRKETPEGEDSQEA